MQKLQQTPEYKISLTAYPIEQSNKQVDNSNQKLNQSTAANYAKPNYNNRSTSNTNSTNSANNLVYQPEQNPRKPIYTPYQQDSKPQISHQQKIANHYIQQNSNQNRISNRTGKDQVPRNSQTTATYPATYPVRQSNNQNSTQIEYSPFKNLAHYNSSANFNTYIFNKPADFADTIKNDNHNSNNINQSSIYSNYNQPQEQQQFNSYNEEYDNSIKQFDLRKLQIPTTVNSLPKFKDFNTYKPKLFVRC